MLVRAAKRHTRYQLSKNILASYQQLQLPWLCPAIDPLFKCNARQSRSSSNVSTTGSSSRRLSSRSPTRTVAPPRTRNHPRGLATQQDAYNDDIPFLGLSLAQQRDAAQTYIPEHAKWNIGDIREFNTDRLVMVKTAKNFSPPVVKRGAMSNLSGDTAELMANLHALSNIGNLPRAAKILQKLATIWPSSATELRDAHYTYLCGVIDAVRHEHASPATATRHFKHMEIWFKTQIEGRGVTIEGRMIVLMIKAAFATRVDRHLERTIRNYLDIAQKAGLDETNDVLASTLLSESELARILRLNPAKYEPMNEDAIQSSTSLNSIPAENVPVLSNLETLNDANAASLPILSETKQKGVGLHALKQSLATFYVSDASTQLDSEAAAALLEARQRRLERDVLSASIARWREEAQDSHAKRSGGQLVDKYLGAYVYEWVQEMAGLVKEEIRLATEAEMRDSKETLNEDMDRLLLAPYLKSADAEKLCATSILSFIGAVNDPKNGRTPDKSVVSVVARIGRAIVHEIQLGGIKSDVLQKYKSLPSAARRRKLAGLLRQKKPVAGSTTETESGGATAEEVDEGAWRSPLPTSMTAKLGALFVSLMMKVAKLPVSRQDPNTGKVVTQIQPIATHTIMFRKGKKTGFLRVNPELTKRMKKEPVGGFIAKYLPMLVEPRKWTSLNRGGPYLERESTVRAVRFRDTSQSQQEYLRIAATRGDMKQVYAGLDVIGKVPWRVNRPLLKVLSDVWNSGKMIGKLAPEDPMPDYPPAPDPSDLEAYRRWKSVVRGIENETQSYHSQRCFQNFQLEVARAYANEDRFYCPHNVDFRGRAYPIPPYFNHMGADYVRGLFMFADGKRLGETGLRWLKIHLANTYGFDKERLEDREAFAMQHLDDVYDSATNPLDGKRWWLTGGHPWQLLAACMELRAALESPVPADYISHLPVQQDGTCNGLQHYAALGGDLLGAQQVNLVPGDKPADIYSAVANLVKQEVSKAAANGDKAAQMLDGKITRKVVKQPVMTNVYGVTYHGARAQVRKQLVDLLPKASLENAIHLSALSGLVANLIFGALGKMFTGAQAIQLWLGECGARISQAVTPEQIERIIAKRQNPQGEEKLKRRQLRSSAREAAKEDYQFKSTIVWTTPLGMPVVQPYRSTKLKAIKTSLQDIYFEEASLSDPVSKRKQLQGFPPNFIHSLDSCHMMLSALNCDRLGLTFASVHDSFWTHAADVPTMNSVLRDAFVRMHAEDIIGRLREEFMARYKGCFHYAPIALNSPLAKKIAALRRQNKRVGKTFLKQTVTEGVQVDELVDEYMRVQLMGSDDAEERARGEAMVTPASLFEAEPDAALPVVDECDVQLLGGAQSAGLADEFDLEAADVPGSESAEAVAGEDEIVEVVDEGEEGDVLADGLAADADADADADVDAAATEIPPGAKAEDVARGKKKKAPRPVAEKMFLWMPMSFPAAPEKGDFNVKALRDSQYFFS